MQVRKATVSIALLLAVIILIGYYYDPSEILSNIRALSFGPVCAFFAALFANAFAAVFRFKIIAKETGHPIEFRRAMAVVSAGTLAGTMLSAAGKARGR